MWKLSTETNIAKNVHDSEASGQEQHKVWDI